MSARSGGFDANRISLLGRHGPPVDHGEATDSGAAREDRGKWSSWSREPAWIPWCAACLHAFAGLGGCPHNTSNGRQPAGHMIFEQKTERCA